MQIASQEQAGHSVSRNNATALLTDFQPEGISRKLAYRRHVLQTSGISSGSSVGFNQDGDNNNAGAQCSGTGNTCQNRPTTVNNNQQIVVYQYLPQSKHCSSLYNTFPDLPSAYGTYIQQDALRL